MRIGIFLTSRNNYVMLDKVWAKKAAFKSIPIINIDEDSEKEEKEYGKRICDKYGIVYMDREKRGLEFNTLLACEYFKDKADYILWFQHDCWPITDDFFNKFNQLVESGVLDNFGTVGFNVIASDVLSEYDRVLKSFHKGKQPLGVFGRSVLTKHKWMCGCKNNCQLPPKLHKYKKPCALESVAYFAIAINVKMFLKHIRPDPNFILFYIWDDISFQFLQQDIYNVFIPDLYLVHNMRMKKKFHIPMSVKMARAGNDKYAGGGWCHQENWKNKWGWDYRYLKHFKKIQNRYKGTLINKIYNSQFMNGPLKSFDF